MAGFVGLGPVLDSLRQFWFENVVEDIFVNAKFTESLSTILNCICDLAGV